MSERILYPDEWYPVLRLSKPDGIDPDIAEFSDEELADIRRVQEEFWVWQNRIAARFGKLPNERGHGPLYWDHEIEETQS